MKHGVTGGALVTKGFAETKPAAPNQNPDGSDDPDGRQKNRRVEITIKKT
jgi:photosystem I P700 chlorophyll a apoprotein A2